MGKKGKRAGKGGEFAKHGAGKARRERAVAMREIEAEIIAFVEKRKEELQDVDVFSPLSEKEDCPLCFLPEPISGDTGMYFACCGKSICGGCVVRHRAAFRDFGRSPCPFCRTVCGYGEEVQLQRMEKRVADNDADSTYHLAAAHSDGNFCCLSVDHVQGRKLFLQAGRLGNAQGIVRLGCLVEDGDGGPKNHEMAVRLYVLAAKLGCAPAHSHLGNISIKKEMYDEGVRHLSHAARGGHLPSLNVLIKHTYIDAVDWMSEEKLLEIEEAYNDATEDDWSEEREKAGGSPRRRIKDEDGRILRFAGELPDGRKLYV